VKKRIAILGSTGSIGTQTLEVIDKHYDRFDVEVLTAFNNSDLLIQQAIKYKPNAVVIGDEQQYEKVFKAVDQHDIKVYAGEAAVEQIVSMSSIDMVLVALVGFSGLKPTIAAIKAKKQIALANKECLVVAGDLITQLVNQYKTHLIPVDSEHSAIYQCIMGENPDSIEKVILTASGGPFRNMSFEELEKVTKKDALNHPTWDMGDKITIDSASLMNKGLEVIEAKWLFGLKPEQIEVVIHPQSIIHSIVQFADGSMKAQMSLPDMRLPIQFALGYPERLHSDFPKFNFIQHNSFTFETPDLKKFRNLALAFKALKTGGNIPCALNAANEVVVQAFLENRMMFTQMPALIEECITKIGYKSQPTLDDYIETDLEVRKLANSIINQNS
jgi:1-deoxy-D-xylulose-5-phosphate reductoisomerase